MKDELTPTMKRAIAYMQRHGGKVVRYPGGYWASETWHMWAGAPYKTPTIEALVRRGMAEYTAWKDGKNERFPIECSLTSAGIWYQDEEPHT